MDKYQVCPPLGKYDHTNILHKYLCLIYTLYTFFYVLSIAAPSPLRVNTAIYRSNSPEAAFTKWLTRPNATEALF